MPNITGGTFLLRIEDTDRERSTPEAVDAILKGWNGWDWDGTDRPSSSSPGRPDTAKWPSNCWRKTRPIAAMRHRANSTRCAKHQRTEGKPMRYDGRWRDRDPADAPEGAPFVIRLKAEQTGETVVHDVVQGDVRFANEQLDDMILLRSRRHADLHAGRRRGRFRHGYYAYHPRRRPSEQYAAPDCRSFTRWAGPFRSMGMCR